MNRNKSRLFVGSFILIAIFFGIQGCAGIPRVALEDCRSVYGNDRGSFSLAPAPPENDFKVFVPQSSYPLNFSRIYNASYDNIYQSVKDVMKSFNGSIITEDHKGGIISFQYKGRGFLPNSFVPFKQDPKDWKVFLNVNLKQIDQERTQILMVYYVTLFCTDPTKDQGYWYPPAAIRTSIRHSGEGGIGLPAFVDAAFFKKLDGLVKK